MSSGNIVPIACKYGCNTRIYWDSSQNAYFEVFTQKKHDCPNMLSMINTNKNSKSADMIPAEYHYQQRTKLKPKMSNSFELLSGDTVIQIQKQYELLSDIVSNYNGKVHGSQRDYNGKTGLLDIVVYYEVPEGKREELKENFEIEKTRLE